MVEIPTLDTLGLALLTTLWRTGEIFLDKPDVASERRNILHYLRGGSHFPSRTIPAGGHVIREGEPGEGMILSDMAEVHQALNAGAVTLNVGSSNATLAVISGER